MVLDKKPNISSIILIPISMVLIFSMFINGLTVIIGGAPAHLEYLNFYNRSMLDSYPTSYSMLFYVTGILQLIGSVVILISLLRKEYLESKNALIFKWGVLTCIFSVVIYGFMVRQISNHGAAANLYFYACLLYLCLWTVEKRKVNIVTRKFFYLKVIPIYLILAYTMGFPGFQKLFNPEKVMGNYVNLFKDSFLSKLPGGIEPTIYFLGIIEIAVPVLILISLIRREFVPGSNNIFLQFSILTSICTFIMLCFGLSLIMNYQGATNLVFYAIFTLGLFYYVCTDGNGATEINK